MQTKSNYINVIRKDNPMRTKISNEFKHWKQNVGKNQRKIKIENYLDYWEKKQKNCK